MTFSNARDFFKMCMSVHNETDLLIPAEVHTHNPYKCLPECILGI